MTVSEIEQRLNEVFGSELVNDNDSLPRHMLDLIADWKAMHTFIQHFSRIPWDELPLRLLETHVLAEDATANLRLEP